MSLSVNSVIVGGNLTRDVEAKAINGKTLAKLGIAMNDKYKAADGTTKESVTFLDVELWGPTADVAVKYLRKGSQCVIEGRLKSDSWQTQDGQKRMKVLLKGERLHLVGSAPDRSAAEHAGDEMARPHKPAPVAADDSEPPF